MNPIFFTCTRLRASASMGWEISTPVTVPPGPTASANNRLVAPAPQPISSTRSPGWGAANVSSASAAACRLRSVSLLCFAHFSPAGPFQ